MKIQTLAPLLVAFLAIQTAHAQAPALEQKTAFCATSAELLRAKRDSSDLYLCQTSKYTCGPYLQPSCLDDAKQGGWDVASSARKSLFKDYANTPCSCVGTEYVLTRKAAPAAVAPVAATPVSPAAAPMAATTLPATAPLAAAPVPAAAGSLAGEVESLKQDNQQIKRTLEQLQRQVEELRRSLPAASKGW